MKEEEEEESRAARRRKEGLKNAITEKKENTLKERGNKG